jgi:hypothetical protein
VAKLNVTLPLLGQELSLVLRLSEQRLRFLEILSKQLRSQLVVKDAEAHGIGHGFPLRVLGELDPS